MDASYVAKYGDALLAAYDTREPITPLTSQKPGLTVEDAYAIQSHQVAVRKTSGSVVRGYKVGLTSRAMRKQLGVDQPDFGHIFDDMIYDEFQTIPTEQFIAPRIEPEITFVLKHELTGPSLTVTDAINAVEYAVASLEIIDSRIADWKIGLVDTIADNASSGALVLGARARLINTIDLATAGCVLYRNGEVVRTGAGAAVLGNPVNGLLWLANKLGSLGQPLDAGSVIMSGSVTAALEVAPGDTFTARFAHLGSITARFATKENTTE